MSEYIPITADSLNAEEVSRLTPLIVFLVIIAVTGIPGNILVCLVHKNRYRQSNSKLFILWLAAIDCLNCCILFLEINNVIHQFTFHGVWLCKLTIFFTLWPTLTSGSALCIISIDRYRKVCKPYGWQITHRMARYMCIMTVLVALLFSWPSLIVFGIREFTIEPYNITGKECTVSSDFEGTSYLAVYNGFLWLLFVSAFVLIGVFYLLIGRKIFKQIRKTANVSTSMRRKVNEVIDKCTSSDVTESSISTDRISTGSQSNRSISKKVTLTNRKMSTASNVGAMVQRQTRAKKSAYIMFLISIAFTISFLPYLLLRLNETINVDFVNTMSDSGRAVYKFFLRTYFLNCAINPFIYCAFASQFRNDVKRLFRKSG